jgi:hypothetical protein
MCSSGAITANFGGPSEGLRILIDELCLYNRALESDEIRAIYEAGTAGKIKPVRDSSTTSWGQDAGDVGQREQAGNVIDDYRPSLRYPSPGANVELQAVVRPT